VHNCTHIYDNPYNNDRARQTGEKHAIQLSTVTSNDYRRVTMEIWIQSFARVSFKFFSFYFTQEKEKNEKKKRKTTFDDGS
jgi:hypothetical protein